MWLCFFRVPSHSEMIDSDGLDSSDIFDGFDTLAMAHSEFRRSQFQHLGLTTSTTILPCAMRNNCGFGNITDTLYADSTFINASPTVLLLH